MEPTTIAVEDAAGMTGGLVGSMFGLFVAVLLIIALWRIFEKAGQPGWAAIIPIYNAYVLLQVVGRPGWWLLLYLVPFVNIVIWIIVQLDLARAFGKGMGFALGLILLPGLFQLILGFGGASYQASPQPA